MRRLFANRLILLLVALLTLGAYGERAFGRFLACDCHCCPAEPFSVITASDKGVTPEAGAMHLVGVEPRKTTDGCHGAEGGACSCLCHAATFANVCAGAPTLGPLRLCAATLHASPPQRSSEGVSAGIEYPPRAA